MMGIKQLFIFLLLGGLLYSQKILIPMDESQTDHLKAYGVAYWVLERDIDIEWLLNYRGGSFLVDNYGEIVRELRLRDVKFETVPAGAELNIYATIENNNMDIVLLEKAPKVAVYSPPGKQPWDDAVTLALEYAEVEYEIIWDAEVLDGKLSDYDYPLRIEFIYFKEFGLSLFEYTNKIIDMISSISYFNKTYTYPAPLVEADIRSRLKLDEIDLVTKNILEKTKAYGFNVPRRENRMF